MTVKSTKKKPVVEKARKVVPFITRHRPNRFSDMIGMESQLNTLAVSIEKGEIPNAFLLIGTTGGGKTTLARIIARTVMCEHRNACGECTSCKIADQSLEQHPDYEEVNCGVNGKVDDIRSLTKLAETVPQIGKMRVIVLDESHRLSGAALEALLKPLEEPAEQTLWILATTETNSLKDTLKNRCSKIFIRPAPADVLGKYLTKLSIDYVEDIPKKDLLKLNMEIAQMTGGYIRESLTILDSVIKTIQAGEYESTDQILEQVRSQLLANVEKDAYAAQKLIIALILGNPKIICQLLADQEDFLGLIRNAVHTNQYLVDSIWGLKGLNIYHPPVFRETATDLGERLSKRGISEVNKIKAYSKSLDTLVQLYGKMMTFLCPERPLITSILLNTMFEIKQYTRDRNKE